MLLAAAFAGPGLQAAELHDTHPYFHFRLGRTHFTNADALAGVELASPSSQPTAGITAGFDVGRVLGLEFAADYVKTDLTAPGVGKVGDYSTWTFVGQARMRFPLRGERFVPYLLVGGGVGLGEFSGRSNFTFPVNGAGIAPLGVVGGGIDYFVADNIALTVEAKHSFLFEPEITLAGRDQELSADSIAATGGLRVYFDRPRGDKRTAPAPQPAVDSDALRGYIALRAGAALFTDTATATALTIENPSGFLGSAAVGVNLNRHVGLEVAGEYTRAQLSTPALGKVSGYPVWTVLALLRLRYPVGAGRLSPYVVAGGGLGFGEFGDADLPTAFSGFTGSQESTFVAAAGAGFDYFVEDNVAVGVELRHTFLFDTDFTAGGQPAQLHPDLVSITTGFRIFFP